MVTPPVARLVVPCVLFATLAAGCKAIPADGQRQAAVARWLAAHLLAMPLGSAKLPLDEFTHEAHFVELPIDGEADPRVMRTEKWLRKHVVERIPGGKAPKLR